MKEGFLNFLGAVGIYLIVFLFYMLTGLLENTNVSF